MRAEGTLDHIGLYVGNLDRSRKFYMDVFGFPEHHRFRVGEAQIAVLETGEGLLELIQRPGSPAEPPKGNRIHVAFQVNDYAAMERRLEGMGLELRKMTRDNGSHIAFFKDPDGHDVEIMEKGLG